MVSYAQNFEDVMLNRCFAGRTNGFYIDVGAWDPVIDSVTKHFYDQGWSGINIEPNENFFHKLMQDRPRDINLNLAIGDKEECRSMHMFKEFGNSTFMSRHSGRFVEQGHQVEEKMVRVTTLANVCREHVTGEIDFLKIDCEGWEKFALSGADWEQFRPTLVVVEATEPMTSAPAWHEWEHILTDEDRYEIAYFDGLNRFYIRKDCSKLKAHFQVPPNVFDDFIPYPLFQARQMLDEWSPIVKNAVVELPALREQLSEQRSKNERLSEQCHDLECRLASQVAENQRLSGLMAASLANISDLKQQLKSTIDASKKREDKLRQTRLWVGQLSQELAAIRG